MPTSYTLLADDVWRCILPYLTLSAIHHLSHLDAHLHRTLARDPFVLTVLADCCHIQPAQLDAAMRGGHSAVSVMRRLLSGAVRVEDMLGGQCGLGKLHQAMLLHSVLCAIRYSDDIGHTRSVSSTSLNSFTASPLSPVSPSHHLYVSSSLDPFGPPDMIEPSASVTAVTLPDTATSTEPSEPSEPTELFIPTPCDTALTMPSTPTSAGVTSDEPSLLLSTPSSSKRTSTTLFPTARIDPSTLSLLYFYEPPDYPLPSPLRILSASSSPAGHFPFPHAYFALWLTSRWDDKQWLAEWLAARLGEQRSENGRQWRKRQMEKLYSNDTKHDTSTNTTTTETSKLTELTEPDRQQQRTQHEEAEWTLERHERVAAATVSDINRCVRWLGEFASPTQPHGELFGYLVSPLTTRQGRTRQGGRDYEYAYIEDQSVSQPHQPSGSSGWDSVPVVSWRVVCAPSRMRYALTVWPCLYVYMKYHCAPGLIDGWARRVGVERPASGECTVKGRMFLHMAAMDQWDAMQ